MIKLDVKPYCHDCTNFEAETNRMAFYSGNHLERMSDCVISCKHDTVCNHINEYLESRTNGEVKDGNNK